MSTQKTDFVDDRAKQESLIKDPDVVNRTESESQIDTGASDDFADDRKNPENTGNSGDQSGLTIETVDDGNQQDLTGETAGKNPQWSE